MNDKIREITIYTKHIILIDYEYEDKTMTIICDNGDVELENVDYEEYKDLTIKAVKQDVIVVDMNNDSACDIPDFSKVKKLSYRRHNENKS